MRRVALATPAFGGQVYLKYCLSLYNSQLLCRKNDINLIVIACDNESILPFARNFLLHEAWKLNVDDLVWLDADMSWQAQTLIDLLNRQVDVVGVPCRKKKMDGTSYNFEPILNNLVPDPTGLLEVNNLGTGFLRMRRPAYEHLYNTSKKYASKGAILGNAFELTFVEGGQYLSEDYSACEKLRAGGFKIYVDTKLSCGHIGSFEYVSDPTYFEVKDNGR